MKLTTLTAATAALAATLAFAQSAQAREHYYRHSYYRHGIAHAAGRYAFAHHYAPAPEQNNGAENYYSDWTEQNNRPWTAQNNQSRWRYRRSAAEAFA
jgi:hypothetical protein